jgi:hypothetical protein
LTQIGGIVINWLRQYDLIPIPVGSSKLSALRAVAEAASAAGGHGTPILFLREWAENLRIDGRHIVADWLEGMADALAALDAARGREK